MSGSGDQPSNVVLFDSQVAGGEDRRKVDEFLSSTFGGYKYTAETGKDPTVYGKYVEPVLHATEHYARGVAYNNPVEIARAKDELRAVGTGLNNMDHKYQKEAKAVANANTKPAPNN